MLRKWVGGLSAGLAFGTAVTSLGLWVPTAQAQSSRSGTIRNPQQVPTARYARGEDVDLALIIDEWRDRYPSTAIFACTCTAEQCGDRGSWPFREFTRYQPFVALGRTNAISNESNGFRCFDIETGEQPG